MIRLIAALDQNRGLAKQGTQPWDLPTDRRYFSDLTKTHGGVLLMGRTTYEVIGHALPDRQNFVATRNKDFAAEGVTPVHDIDAFLASHPEVWVIGGGQIYAATLSHADELYITEIAADYDCDVFFPAFLNKFRPISVDSAQEENDVRFRFTRYTSGP